jgi:hypothetical protein
MTMTNTQTIIYIDDNPQGEFLARPVPVIIDYVQSVDGSYGEDADGHRGGLLVEYDILDAFIQAEDLKRITPEQATWSIENATIIFESSRKHH